MLNAERGRTDSGRRELLLRMYDQMFNDIDRHINVVWQPITVLVGSAALLVAGTQKLISIDIAVALVILLVGWLIATIYDSSYWYNRNLVIIANIERQFLKKSDLKEIHYYFGEHRSKQSMLTHLRIQWLLALGVGLVSLAYHIASQRLSLFCWISNHGSGCPVEVLIPYVAVVGIAIWGYMVKRHRRRSYEEFLQNSPGIKIDTTGIKYGIGHPTDKGKLKMREGASTGLNQSDTRYGVLQRRYMLALAPVYLFVGLLFLLSSVLIAMHGLLAWASQILGLFAIVWSIIHCLVALDLLPPKMSDSLRRVVISSIEGRFKFLSWYIPSVTFYVSFSLNFMLLAGRGLPDFFTLAAFIGGLIVLILLGLEPWRIRH